MKKTALILHAWLNDSNAHWYTWLKTELESRGYTVYLPEIPTMNTNDPNLQEQMEFIEKNIPLDKNMIVFGHSLGCLLGMRLAEKHVFQKLFFIAGWDFNELTPEHQSFWETKINHTLIKQNVKKIYCISSDNDPYITAITAEDMCKRLQGTFILVKGAGHFTEKFGITKIPSLLTNI